MIARLSPAHPSLPMNHNRANDPAVERNGCHCHRRNTSPHQPGDHGRGMTLEEFREAEELDAYRHEPAREMLEVTLS